MVEPIIGFETSEFTEFVREYNSKVNIEIGDKMSKSVQRD